MEDAQHKLNFLDLTIQLIDCGSHLIPSFEIFRKPTFTGTSIHQSSVHPQHQKMATIHASISRLMKLPLYHIAFEKEIHTIQAIADLNTLKVDVYKIWRRNNPVILNLYANKSPPLKREKWIGLPFLGTSSSFLAKKLARYGYKVSFYPLPSIRSISRLKDKIRALAI